MTGSFNWSPSAARTNDETLLVIHSPKLAADFTREMNWIWRSAELGIAPRIKHKLERQRLKCGSGVERSLEDESGFRGGCTNSSITVESADGYGNVTQWIKRQFMISHPLDDIRSAYKLANNCSRANPRTRLPASSQVNHYLL